MSKMITKNHQLQTVIDSFSFDYVNKDIFTFFTYEPTGREIEVFNFGRTASSGEAIKEMAAKGYSPATFSELLDWYSTHKDWKPRDYCGVVALGSVVSFEGERRVPDVWLEDDYRDCDLDWFDEDFSDRCWFAFGRESSALELKTLPLELKINGHTYKRVWVE